MIDRDIPQDRQIRLQDSGREAEDRRAARQLGRDPLRPELAHLLDHDVNRTSPSASLDQAFTGLDQYLLDELIPNKAAPTGIE